ncbi:hypothetical protein R6Z07F_000644 [Ovis aries]
MPLLGLSGDPGQGLFLPSGGGDHSRLSLDSFPLSLIPKAKRKPFSGKNDSLWLFWAPGASPSLTASPPPASCHASTGAAGCWPSARLGKTLSFPPSFLSFSSFLQPPGPPGPLPLSPYLPRDLTCRCTHGSACS